MVAMIGTDALLVNKVQARSLNYLNSAPYPLWVHGRPDQ